MLLPGKCSGQAATDGKSETSVFDRFAESSGNANTFAGMWRRLSQVSFLLL
jgi:hypothetical protein